MSAGATREPARAAGVEPERVVCEHRRVLPSGVGRGRGRVPVIPRLPRRDIAAAVVVSAGALLAPITGGQGSAGAGGWWGALAVVAAFGQGIPLAWRSTRPVAVGGIVLVSYATSALIVGLTPPLGPWIVIWSTGTAPEPDPATPRASPWRSPAVRTWGAAVLTCCMILAGELAHPGSGASVLLLLITALVVTASWTVRADRARVAAVRDKGAADERLRLARELHDVVGHGLGVVAIQTSNARLALQRGDTGKASTAISLAEASSRTAMREMRQMLGVLTEAPDGQPVVSLPGIADIGELVQGVRDTGTPVDWVSAGSWESRAGRRAAVRVPGCPGGAYERDEACARQPRRRRGGDPQRSAGRNRDQQRVRQQGRRIHGWLGPGGAACPRRRPRGATDRWSERDWLGGRSRPPILNRSR